MGFAEKVSQYVLKHVARLGIGVGIWLVMMGVYSLIIASHAGRFYIFHPGTAYILLGIAFICMNLLEWKPLLMLICTAVALGLGWWVLLYSPGEDTAKHESVIDQAVVEEVPDEAAVAR